MNPRFYKWIVLLLPVLPVWSTRAGPPSNIHRDLQDPIVADSLNCKPRKPTVITFPADTTHSFVVRKFMRPEITDTLHTSVRHLLLTPADKKQIYTRDLLLRPQDRFRVVPTDSIRKKNHRENQK